jgi:hypothetical protein
MRGKGYKFFRRMKYTNNNPSVLQFFIIYMPSQQLQGQLQTQHSVREQTQHKVKDKLQASTGGKTY